MPNYNESSIYKLCCRDPSIVDIYIGSTTNFIRRKHCHKSGCNNPNGASYNGLVYRFIRSNGGFENWEMIEVEKYNAHNKRHLESRERYWIEMLNPTLNGCMPIRTDDDRAKSREKYIRNKAESRKKPKTHCDVCNVGYRNWKSHQTSTTHYLLTIVHKKKC